MPDPIPLEMPLGAPAAVEDLVRDVAGAAFRLAGVGELLTGPAAGAPGWLGADATAAEAELTRVSGIVRDAAAAVLAATGRLSAHGEFLRETRHAVGALREEQAEDFRMAQLRLLRLEDPHLAIMTGSPAWTGVVAEIEAAEARRRRAYAALIDDLADDAAATARALADASRPVGGTGGPGDGGRVLAHLATQLPGWGDPVLARRGLEWGLAVGDRDLSPEELAVLAGEALGYADVPAFATAAVRSLGADGVGRVLEHLSEHPSSPVAVALAAVLGAAQPGAARTDRVREALAAEYLPHDDLWTADRRASGMAAVLVAGGATAGLRTATVGEWTRQLLVREDVSDRPVGLSAGQVGQLGAVRDPAGVAVAALARKASPAEAASFLQGTRTWELLLAHAWEDGGEALADLVTRAAEAGPAGGRAVQLGLETIGAGLVEGDPTDRTVDRDVVAAVAPALGDAVAAHVPLAVDALTAAATGACLGHTAELLRGLGYVSVDAGVAATVRDALHSWATAHVGNDMRSTDGVPPAAIAAPSAYVAVLEHGHRLSHALDGFELQAAAERRKQYWDWTAGLVLEVASLAPAKSVGAVADIAGAYGPLLLDMDGTWEQSPYRGPVYDAGDARAAAEQSGDPELARRIHELAGEAEASFARTARLLGEPAPPVSAGKDYGAATLGLVTDGLVDRAKDSAGGSGGRRGR